MSDDIKKSFEDDLRKAALLEKKKADIQAIELDVREHKALAAKARIDESRRNVDLAKNTTFGTLSEEKIIALQGENSAYIESAQKNQIFIDSKTFAGVPFFRKNLIFIGAKTGEGKSTAVANIVLRQIAEKDPITGKHKRVLVLTNEERAEDFYNRLTCLMKGWHYVNHNKFTPEQLKTFNEYIPLLARLVTVIDDSYAGGSGFTTSPEGFETIMESLIREQEWYNSVIIDYYQNFTHSQKDSNMREYDVQYKLATLLDRYKNIYPAPIVIFGQITPAKEGKEDDKSFEFRIKGRKQIIVPATFAMEMIADRTMLKTNWIVHKGRFSEEVGKTIYTGYDKGKFVPYDDAFKQKALKQIEAKMNDAMNRAAGTNFLGTKAPVETPEQVAKGVAGEPITEKNNE